MNKALVVVAAVLVALAQGAPEDCAAPGPYHGTPQAIPGEILATSYDCGGEGVAYHDTDAGNNGNGHPLGPYTARGDDVDIYLPFGAGNGGAIGWVGAGEYVNYGVNVATATSYTIKIRYSRGVAGSQIVDFKFGGVSAGTIELPSTGDWSTFTEVKAFFTLPAGATTMQLLFTVSGLDLFKITFTVTVPEDCPTAAPYHGTPQAIPGVILSTSYDCGGEGVAYHDTDAGNNGNTHALGGYTARCDNVDIYTPFGAGNGGAIGWVNAGEYVNYGVNVATGGDYKVTIRYSRGVTGSQILNFKFGGVSVGTIDLPSTGAYSTFVEVSKVLTLPAGTSTMQVLFTQTGLDLDKMTFGSPGYCLGDDFSTTSNPHGVWSYGKRGGANINAPGPFALLSTQASGGWTNGGTYPDVTPASGVVTFSPSNTDEAIIRYTAATPQVAVVAAGTTDHYVSQSAAHNVVLRKGDGANAATSTLLSGPHDSKAGPVTINTQVTLAAGETVELSLNSLGDNSWDRLRPTMCVTADPIPGTQDPAVSAFCDEIQSQCSSMDTECTTLRSLNHIPVQSPNVLNPTNRHLYRLVTFSSGAQTFAQFRATAQAIGAGWDLATFSDIAEFNFVKDNLVAPHYVSGTRAYTVGAYDSAGGWKWIDGSSVAVSTFFGSGEPNGHSVPYPHAGMDNRYAFKFNDYVNDHYCVGGSTCYLAGFVAEKHTAEPDSEIPDDCDATVAACNDVEADCRAKAATCPLV